MSILNWFKSFFNKKLDTCSCCCNNKVDEHVVLVRKNGTVVLPTTVYNAILSEGYNIGIVCKNKDGKKVPATVQLNKTNQEGKSIYCGTLKDYMNIKSFKDHNVCNFHLNNIIKE